MAGKRREEVAWLLWCVHEGYLLKEDRDVLSDGNWFLEPVESLHEDDARDREGWLQLADSLIEIMEAD